MISVFLAHAHSSLTVHLNTFLRMLIDHMKRTQHLTTLRIKPLSASFPTSGLCQ